MPSGMTAATQPPKAPRLASIPSISGVAQVKTAWNITNNSTPRISSPPTGCRRTESILPVRVSGRSGGRTQAFMIRSASRAAPRKASASGAAQLFAAVRDKAPAAASMAVTSSSMPRFRVAVVGTTDTPSSFDRRSRSMRSP